MPEVSSECLQPTSIHVELQSKSDFLTLRPEFGDDSVVVLSASQLSDFPTSDLELPPSQFCVFSSQSSQLSEDYIVADSQPAAAAFPQVQQKVAATAAAGISQTTIPDSQAIPSGFSQTSQHIIEVPGTWTAESTSPKTNHPSESSGSSIPSHQPESNQVLFNQLLFQNTLFAIDQDHQPLSQNGSSRYHPSPYTQPVGLDHNDSTPNPFGPFFTQPESEPGEFTASAGSKPQSQSQSQVATTANSQPLSVEDTSQIESQQPAQIVSPLHNQTSPFLTGNDTEVFSASQDHGAVPDSSLQYLFRSEQHQERPDRAAHVPATVGSQLVSQCSTSSGIAACSQHSAKNCQQSI